MLNFNQVLAYYPENIRVFKRNILKEYLQYQILDIIYSTDYSSGLIFLGGTAIRIVHDSMRFSEDLDFDSKGLTIDDFRKISARIKKQLQLHGYTVEVENVFKGAFHCYIKFPGLLYQNNLSGYIEEKIRIQLDAEPQAYDYKPDNYLLNRFGIFRYIKVSPQNLLLSQKIHACLGRKKEKGRDFFDLVFLMGKTNPDYAYLDEKLNIATKQELIAVLKKRSEKFNFKNLARDVEPFLFDESQKNRVLMFKQWLKTV